MVTIPIISDHHRGGDHPRDSGCLKDFYHPKGWLLNLGSVESWFPQKSDQVKCEFLCLSVCL